MLDRGIVVTDEVIVYTHTHAISHSSFQQTLTQSLSFHESWAMVKKRARPPSCTHTRTHTNHLHKKQINGQTILDFDASAQVYCVFNVA